MKPTAIDLETLGAIQSPRSPMSITGGQRIRDVAWTLEISYAAARSRLERLRRGRFVKRAPVPGVSGTTYLYSLTPRGERALA